MAAEGQWVRVNKDQEVWLTSFNCPSFTRQPFLVASCCLHGLPCLLFNLCFKIVTHNQLLPPCAPFDSRLKQGRSLLYHLRHMTLLLSGSFFFFLSCKSLSLLSLWSGSGALSVIGKSSLTHCLAQTHILYRWWLIATQAVRIPQYAKVELVRKCIVKRGRVCVATRINLYVHWGCRYARGSWHTTYAAFISVAKKISVAGRQVLVASFMFLSVHAWCLLNGWWYSCVMMYALVCTRPKPAKNSSWHGQMRNEKCVEWLTQDRHRSHRPTQWLTTHNVTHMHIIGFMKCHIQRGTSQITHNAHTHTVYFQMNTDSSVQNVPELICTIFCMSVEEMSHF